MSGGKFGDCERWKLPGASDCRCGREAETWFQDGWALTGCKKCGSAAAAAHESTDQSTHDWNRIMDSGIDIAKLKIGDKVCYQPSHYREDEWENGLVKEIPNFTNKSIRVVYNCGGDWDNFMDYTSALTNLRDLKPDWKH